MFQDPEPSPEPIRDPYTPRLLWEDESWHSLPDDRITNRSSAVEGQCCRWTINGWKEGRVVNADDRQVEWLMNDGQRKFSPWHLVEFLFRCTSESDYVPVMATDTPAPSRDAGPRPVIKPVDAPTPPEPKPENRRPMYPIHKTAQDRLRAIDELSSNRLGTMNMIRELEIRLGKLFTSLEKERENLAEERLQISEFLAAHADVHFIPVLRDSSSDVRKNRDPAHLPSFSLRDLVREFYGTLDQGSVLTRIPLD